MPMPMHPKLESKRLVHFEEQANQTFQVKRLPKQAIWYDKHDYLSFRDNFRHAKKETVLPRKRKWTLIVGKRDIPHMEDLQTFGAEAHVSQKLLTQSMLMHQAICRARGYTDPDGYSFLSKALSMHSRRKAWESAAVNAYEVESFRREDTVISVSSLFVEYYMDSIHPYIHSPLVFLSKILCECE
jgi:hypothetical protein